ncbi:MAG: SMP-30/gluconolactonase/LRE family protein [Robiginitomaculum sp.]
MKTIFKIIAGLLIGLIAYLALWPVAIKPAAWTSPPHQGFDGIYAANTKLADLERLPIGDNHGPEDAVIAIENGREIIYVTSQSGDIMRVDPQEKTANLFANTGGASLGMERDAAGNFIVADAYQGLIKVSPDGKTVKVLTDHIGDSPILYADDLDIASDGMIYFTDASTRFGAQASGSTMAGSLLELMEHGKSGRVLSYNPATQKTALIKDGLSFANGLAMCPDDACILVNETGEYAVRRIWLTGERAGQMDTIVDNLPGFPDNINRGAMVDGRQSYWLGLASPRNAIIDKWSEKPALRKMAQRLPAALRPKATYYGVVIQIDEDGTILQTLQDPSGAYPVTTGLIEGAEHYYITSLESHDLGRMKK